MTDCEHELYWRGMYRGTFNLITPESIGHPAKMAPGLCFRILEHLEELGLLHQGDTILDPLAGTGMTAIVACAKGYRAITVELEEKFIGFQKGNKEYAGRRLHKELDWQIIQGDSRYLSKILAERGYIGVTSPPYAGDYTNKPRDREGDIKRMESKGMVVNPNSADSKVLQFDYGTTPGQIGNLKDAPLVGITSPPYADNQEKGGGIDWQKADRPDRLRDSDKRHNVDGLNPDGYGHTEGQIGALKDKPFKVAMSPPYEDSDVDGARKMPEHYFDRVGGVRHRRTVPYGNSDGQIGQEKNESYLSEMLKVYQEIAKVADVLACVIKNPTRNGRLRRLDSDTVRILEECGWTIRCRHRALLFEEQEQTDLFGETKKKVRGRLSFFRRLAWQKGQPCASWEDVIICVRQ